MNEPTLTIVGNLTADPEIRNTQNGKTVAGFTVASTPRTFNRQTSQWEDGEALFIRCALWGDPAQNLTSLTKGTRVIVTGRLRQQSWTTKDGEKRTGVQLEVDDLGASVKFATVQVNRNQRGEGWADDGAPF